VIVAIIVTVTVATEGGRGDPSKVERGDPSEGGRGDPSEGGRGDPSEKGER